MENKFIKKLLSLLLVGLLLLTMGCDGVEDETEYRTSRRKSKEQETTICSDETEPREEWKGSAEATVLFEEYFELMEQGWIHPTLEDVTQTSWGGITEEYNYYFIMFKDKTADVRWSDSFGEEHIYSDADVELSYDKDLAVIKIDFHQMAGELQFNALINEDATELFLMPDVSTGEIVNADACLCSVLSRKDVPNPTEMVGKWERYETEVEGYVDQTPAGTVIIEITGDSVDSMLISYTDTERSNFSYSDQPLVVEYGSVHYNCGNDIWLANIDYIGQQDTTYAITLLEDGTILLQNYWIMDGAPCVSYERFSRLD